MRLDAHDGRNAGDEHQDERVECDLRAAVDLVRDPAADGAHAGADERAEECGVGEGDLGELAVDEQRERCGVADERTESAGVDDTEQPRVLVAEDGHHAARALARDGQIVHAEPDEDEAQRGRDCPEVADALEVDLMACRVHERCAEESAEAQAEEHRCGEVDDGDTEVADARVDAEGEPLLRFREEEADVCHGGREVCPCDAEDADEQDEGVVGRRGIRDRTAEPDERDEQGCRRDQRPVASAEDGGEVGVDETPRCTDEARQRGEREDLVVGEVESDGVQLRREGRPHRPCDEGECQNERRGVEVLLGDAFAVSFPKHFIFRLPVCEDVAPGWILAERGENVLVFHDHLSLFI